MTLQDPIHRDPLALTGVWERAFYPDVCVMRNEAGDVALSVSWQAFGHSYCTHGGGPPVEGYVEGPGSTSFFAELIGGAGGKTEVARSEAVKAARAAGYKIPDPKVPHAR